MTKAIAVGLGLMLSIGTASAQAPAPAPTPTPAPAPAPAPGGGTPEKAGSNESLNNGAGERPWARGVSDADQALAVTSFREGNVQLNDGLFVQAAELYREALTHWDHPAIRYNLALALLNLDQPIEVYENLQKATQYGPAPLEKDKFEHAKEYMLLIEKQIATIEVSCQKLGAKVSVDGKEVFTVQPGQPNTFKQRVRIGKHTFVAEKPGYATGLDAPFIGPGETFRIELKLYTAEELTRYKHRWNAKWMPYAVIGGGVLAGGIALALEASASSSYNDFDAKVAKCSADAGNNMGCDLHAAGLTSLRDSGDTKRTLGYVGYGLAGAAVATGAVLLYLNRETSYQISSDDYRREQLAKDRQGQKVTITPIISSDMAGAMVFSSF